MKRYSQDNDGPWPKTGAIGVCSLAGPDVDRYRLQSRGVTNRKATAKTGKLTSIALVDDPTGRMILSRFGKIIRIDTRQVRAASRST